MAEKETEVIQRFLSKKEINIGYVILLTLVGGPSLFSAVTASDGNAKTHDKLVMAIVQVEQQLSTLDKRLKKLESEYAKHNKPDEL